MPPTPSLALTESLPPPVVMTSVPDPAFTELLTATPTDSTSDQLPSEKASRVAVAVAPQAAAVELSRVQPGPAVMPDWSSTMRRPLADDTVT